MIVIVSLSLAACVIAISHKVTRASHVTRNLMYVTHGETTVVKRSSTRRSSGKR